MKRGRPDGPLLVFGPRSTTYDFGAWHPLTPRRFGPATDLLRAVGAKPRLEPEPAQDEDLLRSHTARYLAVVKRLSADPSAMPEAGFEQGDTPPFPGMHEAAASVAGGSLRGMEAIVRGDAEHAFHPGGGLHHAMPQRASGFCIYNDPALAIAVARHAGLRVLYLDFDLHHGDGVQAIHAADPGVMTVSFHQSGRYIFPGTGFANELGEGEAAGTVVNVPLEPLTGETAWLRAVNELLPSLAASFGPDLIVSQHGSDAHAWDPLGNSRIPLRITTTAMAEAARLTDRLAHRWARGRWLSTGGGGYAAYHVVPRTWSLVWLAGAHREPPAELPTEWRERWTAEAADFAGAPLPTTFEDEPNAGIPRDAAQAAAELSSLRTAEAIAEVVVPALIGEATRKGWWDALDEGGPTPRTAGADPTPTIERLTPELLARVTVAPRVVPVADAAAVHQLLTAATAGSAIAIAAISADEIVGLALAESGRLVALGVAPNHRRRGLGTALLKQLVTEVGNPISATVTLAERDPVEPLDRALRASIARKMLERARFEVRPAQGDVGRLDPEAVEATRG